MREFDANVLKQVATEVRNIKAEYHGVASEESIDLVARQSLNNLANSKVPQFVPLFVGPPYTRATTRAHRVPSAGRTQPADKMTATSW